MRFLENILHIRVTEGAEIPKGEFPNYLAYRYAMRTVRLDAMRVTVVRPAGVAEEPIHEVRSHVRQIRERLNRPCVLELKRVTARRRKGLIDAGIPFVVEGKQCYLPFMGALLADRCDAEKDEVVQFRPSTQLLLFGFLLSAQKELAFQEAAVRLKMGSMAVSRAARQLEDAGLVKTVRRGVAKFLTTELEAHELFVKLKDRMVSPIVRQGYLTKDAFDKWLTKAGRPGFVIAGEEALAHRSMLSAGSLKTVACPVADESELNLSDDLLDPEHQVAVQIWSYDPTLLSKDGFADPLSLAACFRDDPDERIEESVEQMLNELWSRIHD